ncbi:polysaccharide biosynthesis tyrosine autokinase [Paralysiella testudinis]|uniref:Putative tyrosine-protein kinase EpsB n=1 Tax=Paralysiella testudinis TaxID=2809020 RepID=A0A892ZJ38_9NEIS|nr:polysaccharide biosynthesis tyrosine autokinase [Paralysiella testudinis]QRQ82448.1 polysaccharide biosynthesis tyrosine autokinase [Paralysiella testudinis]
MAPQTNTNKNHSAQNTDDEIDLSRLLSTLFFHKYQIGAAIAAGVLVGGLYAVTATPIYRADAMLEISSNKNQILSNLTDILPAQQSVADPEVELIRSRLVLGKTVEDLKLDITVTPKYFPLVGKLWHGNSADPVAEISVFTVSPQWHGKAFTLTAQNKTDFTVVTPDGDELAGKVGTALEINADSRLLVRKLLADEGQRFTLEKSSFLSTIDNMLLNLSAAARGRNSPIIGLSYTGEKPEKIQTILNSIIHNYVQQNRDKDVQMAANGLNFITEELPRLKGDLQQAENKLNAYRAKSGSLDIPVEAKGALDSLSKIEMQITDLKTEEAGLTELYTREHPAYKALLDKLSILNQAKTRLNQQITAMPQTQQEIIRLTRDVEINQAIYVQLLNKQQELGILKASSQGNVRVIDQAMTADKPIKPKKSMIVLLSAVVGGLLAAGWYLVKALLHRGINSADEIEALDLDVLASVPLSEVQRKRDKLWVKLKREAPTYARANVLLALKDPTDTAIEAIRALRTSLYFSMMDARNNVVMISGATPGVGKSFVSANLAVVMAQSEKKVLLIDGDMRKGYMHHLMETEVGTGLAEILQDNHADYAGTIQHTSVPNLDFISAGKTPENPSELLLNGRIGELLAWAGEAYDYVVLDTPPVLAVTDAAVMGQYAGVVLLVTRFGQTAVPELEACITRFANSKVRIDGVILNGIERTAQNYYSYENYAKKYQSE